MKSQKASKYLLIYMIDLRNNVFDNNELNIKKWYLMKSSL